MSSKSKISGLYTPKGGGERLLVFRQQHWWVPASTIRGHPQSVPFLGEVVTGLVPSCYCICFFTIHRMLCTCCKHPLPSVNYALKAIFPSSQGGICVGISSWLFVCSSGASSIFLCFCYRTVLLSSCENTFSVALTFTRSLKFAPKHPDMPDHMQKFMGWHCWTLLA